MTTTVCKTYLFTGNCPQREICKQSHPEKQKKKLALSKKDFKPAEKSNETGLPNPLVEEKKVNDQTATNDQTKPNDQTTTIEETKIEKNDAGKRKLQLKGKKLDEFIPGTGFLNANEEQKVEQGDDSYSEEMLDAFEEEAIYWNDDRDDVFYMERDPMYFHEGSKSCTCCKGHIYNCDGDICQNLESCFCYALEEDEATYQETRQG